MSCDSRRTENFVGRVPPRLKLRPVLVNVTHHIADQQMDRDVALFMFKNPIQYGIPANDWANKNGCKNFDT